MTPGFPAWIHMRLVRMVNGFPNTPCFLSLWVSEYAHPTYNTLSFKYPLLTKHLYWGSLPLIAYSKRCQIHDLRRRFSFRIRDKAWLLRAFVLLQWKRTGKVFFFFFPEKVFDIDIRRGMENAPLASLIKALYTFTRPTPTTYILN